MRTIFSSMKDAYKYFSSLGMWELIVEIPHVMQFQIAFHTQTIEANVLFYEGTDTDGEEIYNGTSVFAYLGAVNIPIVCTKIDGGYVICQSI